MEGGRRGAEDWTGVAITPSTSKRYYLSACREQNVAKPDYARSTGAMRSCYIRPNAGYDKCDST